MNAVHSLEDFLGEAAPVGPMLPVFGAEVASLAETVPDGGISEAYDLGYQTGWAARDLELAEGQAALLAELQETLHGLTFTLEEAKAHVIAAIAPVFRALVQRVLPDVASRNWADIVAEEALSLSRQAGEAPITLTLAPAGMDLVTRQVGGIAHPFRIDTDPALSPHQARFRFGAHEALFDYDALLEQVRRRIDAEFPQISKDVAHG